VVASLPAVVAVEMRLPSPATAPLLLKLSVTHFSDKITSRRRWSKPRRSLDNDVRFYSSSSFQFQACEPA
jgi:hypothetical protein